MGEDVKYSVLSAESVKTYAEFVGFLGLPDSLAVSLSEDVTYRLRETVQNASQFMKHAKRRRLTAGDFNRALHWSATEPIYGHGSVDELPFKSTTIKEKDIFFVDDKEIGMRELALGSAIPTDPGKMTVSAQRLFRESSPNSVDQQKGQALPTGEASATGSNRLPLTDASRNYYDQITNAILGESEPCQRVALRDLETNPKISPLLPYFVNLIASGVKSYSHDLTLLRKLMNMVTAIVNNHSFFLEPYVIQLVTSVMYCLLESLAASLNPANNHWSVRDESARLLAHISRKCNNPVNYLHQQLLMTLQEVLLDDGRPLCSHYGAVVGLTELGLEALEQFLFPHLSAYWTQLQQVLEDDSQSNAQLQDEAYQVYGALLQAAGCLLRSKQKGVPMNTLGFQSNGNSHPVLRSNLSPWAGPSLVHRPAPVPSIRSRSSSTNHASNLHQLYQQLYEVFGDSLVPRIAFNNWQDGAVTKSKLLRIQPLTHKYFPVRPLQRDAKAIRELIDKAKEIRSKGKSPVDINAKPRQLSPAKVPAGQRETQKTKVVPFTITSCSRKVLSAARIDDVTFEKSGKEKMPSPQNASRRKSRSSSQRDTEEAMKVDEQVRLGRKTQRVKRKVETGKIKRTLKRTRPLLANKTKYDYHVGVAL